MLYFMPWSKAGNRRIRGVQTHTELAIQYMISMDTDAIRQMSAMKVNYDTTEVSMAEFCHNSYCALAMTIKYGNAEQLATVTIHCLLQ